MARYRLRFLLQEFDLVGPEAVLGRSPDCHITIEDPLVSRRHARIRMVDGVPRVADLGSRNGVRINGELIDGERQLMDGDRIRLGTQELVFSVVRTRSHEERPTGFMRVCGSCGTPHPEQAKQCPHCGHVEVVEEEDTISGLSVGPRRSWTFQLLGEVIERAITSGRATEAERLMRRAASEVDDRLGKGDRLESGQVGMITGFALRLASLLSNPEWVVWSMKVYRSQQLLPSSEVVTQLEEIHASSLPGVKPAIRGFVEWWRESEALEPNEEIVGRLEQLTH